MDGVEEDESRDFDFPLAKIGKIFATALMVTHSMQQAVDLPDRIIMMHRGQIVEDYHADMKRRVRIPDLIAAFDRVQKRELFDESVANLLAEQYC